MKYYRPELYALCKSNGIKGCSKMNKDELLVKLRRRGIIEEEEPKAIRTQQQIDDEKDRVRGMRTKPKEVKLTKVETGEVFKFGSTYKAAKFLGKNSGIIANYNGKIYNGYLIEIGETLPFLPKSKQPSPPPPTSMEEVVEDKPTSDE